MKVQLPRNSATLVFNFSIRSFLYLEMWCSGLREDVFDVALVTEVEGSQREDTE